ncbi:MAG: hypothetical protein U9Q62_02090, partial [Campylobacterota bacterium]|nr:hypothetical protein [Campylobacterota bacterium]
SDAQYALGNIYFKGPELFKEAENFFYSYKDNNRGSYWYDQAAMQGDERAMCKLVRLYADSEEVEQYLDISAYWAYMLRQKENDCTDDLWNSMELHQYLNFDNDGNPSKPDTLDKILKDAEYWNSLGAPDIDYDMPPPIDDSLGDDVQIENAFKTEGIVKFGDRVRVISTELTDQKDLSGLEGDVTGISTPSMFPDDYYGEVVGEPENDELVSVFFNESNKTFWFAPHLLVRIESDGDMQISVESTGMTFQQDAEGNWTERTSDKPWWKFW